MAEVVCLGELLVDFVPTVTGCGIAGAEFFRKAAGGAPANVAVGLARLGVPSAFMGTVGADGFGRFLADTLRGAGVDTAPLRFAAAARTSLAFVSLADDGDREFLFYREPGADTLLSPADVDAGAARDGIRRGLAQAQIVKISEEEVEFLSGHGRLEEGVRQLWHEELRLVAVTRGRDGSAWFTPDASGTVPGFAVAAVDATGAGDAFMAGLLAGVLARPGPLDPDGMAGICAAANAAGALATTVRGAIPAMPDRAAVEALVARG